MKLQKSHLLPLFLSGFLFSIDQVLKYKARMNPYEKIYIIKDWVGWEFFGNTGIAFSIPFPNIILVIGTPIILLVLLVYIEKKEDIQKSALFGAILIFLGAISNLIDRILFEITIDYIRIATSVINIADIMIILGTILMLIHTNKIQVDKKK